MKNEHYTLMLVPERTQKVYRVTLPAWLLRTAGVSLGLLAVLLVMMFSNYWAVLGKVSENADLRTENRRLKQQTQLYRSRVAGIEATLERIKTLSTKIRIITDSEDRGGAQALMKELPEAASNLGKFEKPEPVTELQAELDTRDPELAFLIRDENEMETFFKGLMQESLKLEVTLQGQLEILYDQKDFLGALPTRKPTVGYFTSGFGVRKSPYGGTLKMHEGLDIANRPGTPIRATADGVVAFASSKPGYGQTVILDHGYGLETWYAHARKILVASGQKIKRGEPIALLGNTGRSTGPHLHYEVRVNGIPVDPLPYILEN
jgi:murein DD-endopeptidase MepM/ murein hydrolase activator NlpD